ncbi:MAG: hypothetical protein FJX89_02250 [Bacteroidetes bacterium]|nr:hypothetical protein [Bacteroidota bacterium]
MSTIFGIVRREGPATRGDAGTRMFSAMDHWQADHRSQYEEGGLLLAHLLLRNTPAPETSIHHLGPYSLTADLRLYNRADCLRRLGIDPGKGTFMPDGLIVLHVFQAFGVNGLAELVGDYAFALYDASTHTLLCVRDSMGVRPLCYSILGSDLVFASEPRGILAHPETDTALDDAFILQLMAGQPPDAASTFRRGIRHLLPGHMLQWRPEELRIHPLRRLTIPALQRFRHPADYQEAFREQLQKAVACRLPSRGPVGVELSGGLDSSAIAAFAAPLCTGGTTLHSFTLGGPEGLPGGTVTDEWQYAKAVLAHCGISQHLRVSSGGWAYPSHAQDLHISDHGGVDLISPFWQEPAWRLMRQQGIHTSLSGFFGDEVATHPARLYYHDFLLDGRILAFLQACHAHRDYTLPFRRLAKACLPAAMRSFLQRRTPLPSQDACYLVGPPPRMDIGPADDRPFSLRRHLLQRATSVYPQRRLQNESLAAIRYRIDMRYPLADIRLVEFVLSLPPEALGHVDMDRHLYRSSMKGWVPEEVRLRTEKHVPLGIFPVHELRNQLPWWRAAIADIRSAAGHPLLHRLDFARIDRDLDPTQAENTWQGVFVPRVPFHILALARFFDERTGPSGLSDAVRLGDYSQLT